MLIPIRTDYRLSRRPWVNYAILVANVAIFLGGYNGADTRSVGRIWPWLLHPDSPELFQFFSSVFLHGSWLHLLGNMVFLWVFGNAINDRLGHLGYLAFYLAGGVLAGVGYVVMSGGAPVLGASGAIAAVTGAYLVLFPRTRVTVLMFLYFITWFEVSSLLFLAFQFLFELYMSIQVSTGVAGVTVAHWAHSSGYLFGIAVAAMLLALRLLPRDAFDLLNLFRASRRRSQYRRMAARGYDPFRAGSGIGAGRSVASEPVAPTLPDIPDDRQRRLRSEISEAHARGDLPAAAQGYLDLVLLAEDAVLPRQQQLDIANQLMSTERHPQAADAYERFCGHYPRYEHRADIYLMLGILYGRYLHQLDRAEHYLQRAVEGLRDARKQDLARADLAAVRARRGQ